MFYFESSKKNSEINLLILDSAFTVSDKKYTDLAILIQKCLSTNSLQVQYVKLDYAFVLHFLSLFKMYPKILFTNYLWSSITNAKFVFSTMAMFQMFLIYISPRKFNLTTLYLFLMNWCPFYPMVSVLVMRISLIKWKDKQMIEVF